VNGEPIEMKMDDGEKYEPVSIHFSLGMGKNFKK